MCVECVLEVYVCAEVFGSAGVGQDAEGAAGGLVGTRRNARKAGYEEAAVAARVC